MNKVIRGMNKLNLNFYCDFSKDYENYFLHHNFDSNGLPIVNYGKRIGFRYNPVTVSQYGIANLQLYLKNNNEKNKNVVFKASDWLVEHAENYKNSSFVWFYKFDVGFPKMKKPWISAMAQGNAISLLSRAYHLSNNEKYLNIVKRAVNILDLEVKSGGTKNYFPDNKIVYEEYPTSSPSCVLNGFIFALFGLYDAYSLTGDLAIKKLFDDGIDGLISNLFRYDVGFWTIYDLSMRKLSSVEYHLVHIEQMRALYDLTGIELFQSYGERWIGYKKSLYSNARYASGKVIEKFMLKFINSRNI